jgi:hypothetical protein
MEYKYSKIILSHLKKWNIKNKIFLRFIIQEVKKLKLSSMHT